MADYQRTRDEAALPMFEFTCDLATLQPPPPELQQLLGAMRGNQRGDGRLRQRDRRHRAPAEFFAPGNVGRIMQAA